MGRRVIEALGIGTAATHMEWFFGPKGLKFSEIGCRPPGVGQWDVYCAANEFDLFREWALAVCHGRVERQPSRRYACGMIALRPDRDGRIAGYEGGEEIWRRFGDCIVAHHFPHARHPYPARGGRLHGQCLDAPTSSRLRRASQHPEHGGRDDPGPRALILMLNHRAQASHTVRDCCGAPDRENEIGRHQRARPLEVRAATSLARLCADQGERRNARNPSRRSTAGLPRASTRRTSKRRSSYSMC